MATVIIQQLTVCDMCGREADHFIDGSGEKFTADMGSIQTQGEAWKKEISININASIPYHSSDDICTNCLKDALEKILIEIEGEQ